MVRVTTKTNFNTLEIKNFESFPEAFDFLAKSVYDEESDEYFDPLVQKVEVTETSELIEDGVYTLDMNPYDPV